MTPPLNFQYKVARGPRPADGYRRHEERGRTLNSKQDVFSKVAGLYCFWVEAVQQGKQGTGIGTS